MNVLTLIEYHDIKELNIFNVDNMRPEIAKCL